MLNQCNFIGRVGKTPEIRDTPSSQVANFTIACSEKYKGEEYTEWINVVAWGKLAEIIGQYVGKGDLIYISGKMQTRKWQDKEGNDKYTTEINAKEMKMLGGKKDSAPREAYASRDDRPLPDDVRDYDDSVPF